MERDDLISEVERNLDAADEKFQQSASRAIALCDEIAASYQRMADNISEAIRRTS